MEIVVRLATLADIDTLFLITNGRDEIRANGFYQRLGWSVVGRVDGDDVRYEKSRAS
nr:hypothetical protein [Pseudomonas costantinii]